MSDRIVTHPANDAYRAGYDAIFCKQERPQDAHTKPTRNDQGAGEHMQRVGAGQISRD